MLDVYFNRQPNGKEFRGLFGLADMGGNVQCSERCIGNLPEFLREAGRDYYVKKVPAFQANPDGTFSEVSEQFHLARSSDNVVVSPTTVKAQYGVLSLMDIAEEVKPMVDAGWAQPESVWSARKGALDVLSLRLDEGLGSDDMPNGERFRHYMVMTNPYGDGGKAQLKFISFRMVCCNTFAAGVAAAADGKITHRVAKGDAEKQAEIMAARAKVAVATWDAAQKHVRRLAERIDVFSGIAVSETQAEQLTRDLLSVSGTDRDKWSGQARTQFDATMAAFDDPKNGTDGNDAWDFLNAVTYGNSNAAKGSKVSAIARVMRNIEPNGTGVAKEAKAIKLVSAFAGL